MGSTADLPGNLIYCVCRFLIAQSMGIDEAYITLKWWQETG